MRGAVDMDKYVKLEAAKRIIDNIDTWSSGWRDYAKLQMDSLPAADVAPVRHGTWTEVQVTRIAKPVDPNDWTRGLLIHDEQRLPSAVASMRCSNCKRYHNEVYIYGNPTEMVHYCPNCGATMDVPDTDVGENGR